MLEEESGKKPDRSLSADEAVAHGAAIYAGLLLAIDAASLRGMSRDATSTRTTWACSASSRGRAARGTRCMIPAQHAPARHRRGPIRDAPARARGAWPSRSIEGGDASGNNATRSASASSADLPPGLPAGTRIEVEFRYAGNGTLAVEARLPDLGQAASLGIDRASGLTEVQLSGWEARVRDGFRPLNLDA